MTCLGGTVILAWESSQGKVWGTSSRRSSPHVGNFDRQGLGGQADRGYIRSGIHFKTEAFMARLPQRWAPLIYGVIQAAITTGVATAIATLQLTDFKLRFVEEWLFAWGLAFLTMLPVVIFVSPLIQRCVLALTFSPSGEA
jgi:hypothetical protein